MKILHQMIHLDEYQLSSKYSKKFAKRSKLAAILMVYAFNITYVMAVSTHAIFFIIAYFDPNVYHSIVVNVIWQVIYSFSTYHVLSLIFIFVYFMYIFSIYMKYRFKQIGDFLNIYARNGMIFKNFKSIFYM
jgi:hypothetical protein